MKGTKSMIKRERKKRTRIDINASCLKIKGDSYESINLILSPSGIKLFYFNCHNPSLSLEAPKTLSII